MDILEYMRSHLVLLDGGMGSLLISRGLRGGERPESWNLTHPEVVEEIHRAYYDAGSNVVLSNTFGANTLHFSREELRSVIPTALRHARAAAASSGGEQEKFVALDIGPLGKLLAPLGELSFDDAYEIFAETVRCGAEEADLIFIETMNDMAETRAALLAAKENSSLPVFVSNAYSPNGKLLTGAEPAVMVALLEGMGADAIGVNCSMEPRALAAVAEEYLRCATVPVIFKPNAGRPEYVNGQTVYHADPWSFAEDAAAVVRRGVRCVGGCCGTTPKYVAALRDKLRGFVSESPAVARTACVTSDRKLLRLGEGPVIVGDRINPTGRADLREGLAAGELKSVLAEAKKHTRLGAQVIDVNVSAKGIDQPVTMERAIRELQLTVNLPLQIDTVNTTAMERALRAYNGRALVNSVNGREDSMRVLFPLVKKYGGTVVCLTLDEKGLPVTVEERVAIAERILAAAKQYGLTEADLIFDPLVLSARSGPGAAALALETIRQLKRRGLLTMAATSNISFGLPGRGELEKTFMAMALEAGVDLLLCNPGVKPGVNELARAALLGGEEEMEIFKVRYTKNDIQKEKL